MTAAQHSERKRTVRALVRERRAALPSAERSRRATALSDQLIALTRNFGAGRVTCYLPTESEPDPSGFLAWASTHRIDVLLPVSLPGRELAWVLAGREAPALGLHGILEPTGPRLRSGAAATADLLLIPACAVDRRGTRLGWGLGYYDRCLAALPQVPPVYAVVFDEDVFDELPSDPHDVPVTGAVTPSGIRQFTA